ncbi:MAG: AMP-binding protein [Hydrogenoanaerobacterium sp.]
MYNFLKELKQIVEHTPDKIALKVSLQSEGMSYALLDMLSGRVLSYLSRKGIGKEDFVAICLPRGADPIVCVVGVLKAGAAFVIIEESYAPERAAYIKKDCGCKLTIDYAVWQEIQQEQPSDAIASWDEHAAAFAVYTSGSTGNPKGVLHEYGHLNAMIASSQAGNRMRMLPDDRMALIAPLTFVTSVEAFLTILFASATLYIVPYAVVKNPKVFMEYLFENCISVVFLPPSAFRVFPKFGPHMRLVMLGGEMAVQTYREDITVINAYGSSETGGVVCYFVIDKLYDITPIGTPTADFKLFILDENGNPVPDGEVGELCVYLPFTRGYLNRPEENERAFQKGHIYHTGDLACKQADGNYVMRGRMDDMIKINGNRIEPGEIEAVVKRVLNLDWVAVKGFLEGDSGFICVYYTKDIEIDEEKTRQTLLQYLPYYMLPTHFIKLDSVPLNPHGKLDRKALLPPCKEANRSEYVAPRNQLEERLCKAFAEALGLERIGINDDFYQLGGDSLTSMTALVLCEIKELTVAEIFRGRTPAKVAKLCEELCVNSCENDAQAALKRSFLLTPEQLYMVDCQLYAPKSTMHNLSMLARLGKHVDIERFTDAVSKTIARHPALLTVFGFNEDGDMIQHYDATLAKPLVVEQISESALEALKDSLIYPYTIVGSLLYRCRIFKTEMASYFFFDVHHTVFDGTSFHALLNDIEAIYSGKTELQEDSYYSILAENVRIKDGDAYKEGLNYFRNRYGAQDFSLLEPYANKTAENRLESLELGLPKIQDVRLASVPGHQPVSNNVLFAAITALALARHSKKSCVNFEWVYNGRSSVSHISTVGLLFNILPLSVQLSDNLSFSELLEDIVEQVRLGIQYGCVHYVSTKFQSQKDYAVAVIYQDKMRDFATLCGEEVTALPIHNAYAAANCALDIEITQEENETQLWFHYNNKQFDKSFMEELINIWGEIAKKLLTSADMKELHVNDLI